MTVLDVGSFGGASALPLRVAEEVGLFAARGLQVRRTVTTDSERLREALGDSAPEALGVALVEMIRDLPPLFSCVMIDSVTNLIVRANETQVIEFFSRCKIECDRGRTIFLIAHAHAFNEQFLTRVRSLCDAHLSLKTEAMGETLMKIMEVAKVRGAEMSTGNIVTFDVEPGLGMNIIPVSKAKA